MNSNLVTWAWGFKVLHVREIHLGQEDGQIAARGPNVACHTVLIRPKQPAEAFMQNFQL